MRKTVDKMVGGILIFLMMAMTVDVLWGVVTRYVFSNQAGWTEELARFLLIWIGILGAAYASGKNMHLAIDLLKPGLSPVNQLRLSTFIHLLIISFAITVLVIGGIRLIYITSHLGQLSAAMRIPMSAVYSVVPVSGLLVVYYSLSDIIELQLKRSMP